MMLVGAASQIGGHDLLDYRAELERRITQFRHHLAPMDYRAHEEAQGPCYLIFENQHPDGGFGGEAEEVRQPALAAMAEAFGGSAPEPGEPELPDLPEEGWREEGERIRFVQFSFERDWFCMDLPRQTLSFDEAMELVWYRRGFFYLRDKPQFTLKGEPEGYDPFRRVYLYGEEGQAAEDTAFVIFRAWGLPVDSRLYVTAAAFGGGHAWERGTPLA
jgi:hypothetical protein